MNNKQRKSFLVGIFVILGISMKFLVSSDLDAMVNIQSAIFHRLRIAAPNNLSKLSIDRQPILHILDAQIQLAFQRSILV